MLRDALPSIIVWNAGGGHWKLKNKETQGYVRSSHIPADASSYITWDLSL